jgi:integrase
MTAVLATVSESERQWMPRLDRTRYDCSAALTGGERDALALLSVQRYRSPAGAASALARLIEPIDDALDVIDSHPEWWGRSSTRGLLLAGAREHGLMVWGWDREQWLHTLRGANNNYRQAVAAVGYLLCDQRDLHRAFRGWKMRLLTGRVFGPEPVDHAVARVQGYLDGLGHATVLQRPNMQGALYELMLLAGSPLLEDLAEHGELLAWMRARETNNARRNGIEQLTRTLVDMGVMARLPFATQPSREEWLERSQAGEIDVPPEWLAWTRRWFETSTLARTSRMHTYYALIKAGRWLHAEHPDRAHPAAWDRELAAAWIAAVNRLKVGELSKSLNANAMRARYGEVLSPRSKASLIGSVRTFFCDLQEWEWIERGFDPRRALGIPRSILALIGPDPRVIADDIWAKLMWAGLNLTRQDLPKHANKGGTGEPWYPLELVRAVAMLWLFAGLRVDEILRLRVGAARWQSTPDHTDDGDGRVCLLDVPVNKTTSVFTKPVDRLVGEAIDAWQVVRPAQPKFPDRKTGELVDMLLAYRGAQLGEKYINRVLIPLLCGKAGVPRGDVRGAITSHRARATIATQLYNAKDPMSLFELQAWLGHSSPHSTQHYARITPLTLTKAYTDAGYFARNVRTIEVLLDRDAITNSRAGTEGGPFEFYDLGHGYCSYSFFEQCPHRMACARCDFYIPKPSSQAQLLEAKGGLQRMLVQIPLTDEERAAVEGDQQAVDSLIDRLGDVATPAGPTPVELKQTKRQPAGPAETDGRSRKEGGSDGLA